jgi:hypothetical protein
MALGHGQLLVGAGQTGRPHRRETERVRAFGPNTERVSFSFSFSLSFVLKPFSNSNLNQFWDLTKPLNTKRKMHQHVCINMLLTL